MDGDPTASSAGLVLIERRGPATWLTLNRPDKLNALNAELLGELQAALRAERTSDSRVLVIAGAGRAFSAGHDVSGTGTEAEVPDDAVDDRNQQAGYIDLFMQIWEHPKPVLTAIQGYCMAGASQMCVFADLNVVAEDAVLSASPVIPLGGGFISPLWAYLVGTQRPRCCPTCPVTGLPDAKRSTGGGPRWRYPPPSCRPGCRNWPNRWPGRRRRCSG